MQYSKTMEEQISTIFKNYEEIKYIKKLNEDLNFNNG